MAIVGRGLIGASIEQSIRTLDPRVTLVTVDRGDDLQATFASDLVVLCAPVSANLEILRELRGLVAPNTLITDTGSTKAATVEAAAGLRFIGGHPIAGAAGSGSRAAQPDLFAGRPWVLTPTSGTKAGDLSRLERFVRALGAKPVAMTAEQHDHLFAYVSHLPQLAISALMHVAGRGAGDAGLALAGSGLRDSTRLAGSPAGIWTDIVATNRREIAAALDAYIAALQQLRDDASEDAVTAVFESAARSKAVLDRTS